MNLRKKNMIMLAVGALLIVMAVGYAAAYTMLQISGTASMEATWNVAITGIDEGTPVGTAYNKSIPTYTGTTATFDVGFKDLGDSMTYSVTVTNNGTIDAKVSQLYSGISSYNNNNSNDNNKKISIITSGIKEGDVLKSGESKDLQVYLELPEYNSIIVNNETTSLHLYTNIIFEQDDNKTEYAKYDLNDRIMLTDGSIWRVFESSSNTDNTVKIIKEIPISNSQLGETNTVSEYNEYLNSDYKNTLSESIRENVVGDITIPKFVTFNSNAIYHKTICPETTIQAGYGDEDYIDNISYSEINDGTMSKFLLQVISRNVGNVDNNLFWMDFYAGQVSHEYNVSAMDTVMYVDDFSNLQLDNPNSCASLDYNNLIINRGRIHKNSEESTYTVKFLGYSRDERPDIRPVMTIKKSAIK